MTTRHTLTDAGRQLGVSYDTVRRLIAVGRLPRRYQGPTGRTPFLTDADLDEYRQDTLTEGDPAA